MGGGQRFQQDVARRGSADLLQAVADVGAAGAANGGSLAQAAEFCAREHKVPFRVTSRIPPAPGDPVTLALGSPPVVMNGGSPVGIVDGPSASALNGCLRLDWTMVGTVLSVNAIDGEGVAIVVGSQ